MKRVYLSPLLKVESAIAPEVISITTELLSTPDYSLDRYSEAALGHVESFQDFKTSEYVFYYACRIICSKIKYSFTDEENQTPLQNLQAWALKDGDCIRNYI
jgi:hypothetical protein